MKKLVFVAIAAVALTASVSFVSCQGTAAPADTIDTTEVVVDDTICQLDSVCADSVACDSVAE